LDGLCCDTPSCKENRSAVNNMVSLASPHSTVELEAKFQLWKRVKTGFYNSGKNDTFTVIKLVKSTRHHSKLQASLKILKIKKEEVDQFT